jgi:uncharacterized membrane protein YfcA
LGVSLEGVLVAVAGFVGGFVSTLASNGSSVTLPALDLLGLPEHVANGTNRLSVVALGLVGTIHFYREGLVDWREGARIAVLIALGTVVGAFIAVDLSNAVLDAIVIAGLLLVLGSGFFMLAALVLLTGYDLRHGNAMKAFILLVVGLQSHLVFAASSEVDWSASVPLALGSAVGA